MRFLCSNAESLSKKVSVGAKSKVNVKTSKCSSVISGTVWTGSVFQVQVGNDSVLPTFTCCIGGRDRIRGLKDSGCQPHFIRTDIAEELRLNVVKDKF